MNSKLYFLFVAILFLFASCQVTENIYFNGDGSGKMAFEIDASSIMGMMGEEMASGKQEVMDSTFTFKSFYDLKRDSIAQLPQTEQDRLKKMENLSVNMKMNTAESVFKITMFSDFKSATEMQDMMAAMNSVKDWNKNTGQQTESLPGLTSIADKTDLKYSFDGKTFKRNVKIINSELFNQVKDSSGVFESMLGSSNYVLKYNFPKKVKSVSNPNAVFSEDKKQVTVEYSFSEYFEKPESMNLEVILEQ